MRIGILNEDFGKFCMICRFNEMDFVYDTTILLTSGMPDLLIISLFLVSTPSHDLRPFLQSGANLTERKGWPRRSERGGSQVCRQVARPSGTDSHGLYRLHCLSDLTEGALLRCSSKILSLSLHNSHGPIHGQVTHTIHTPSHRNTSDPSPRQSQTSSPRPSKPKMRA